jgi:UDP-2,3-diacylglucosamine pyrophosphatase LpxH
MPDIRYVCLSDMHLGEEDSILTHFENEKADPTKLSPVMQILARCLHKLISENEGDTKPTLILNGDILDMAFARTHEALMAFERFIEVVMPSGEELFRRIVYIPGNHDHHIWELARETRYASQRIGGIGVGEELPEQRHATALFVEEGSGDEYRSTLLTNLITRFPNLEKSKITVAYPNFGLYRSRGDRCVVFHHGHFVESKYYLMSSFNKLMHRDYELPTTVNRLEADNFAWIDFFWSTMGRSGRVGLTVEELYEKMEDPDELIDDLEVFADNVNREYNLPGPKRLSGWALKALLCHIARRVIGERSETEYVLSKGAEDLLKEYMKVFLYNQLKMERDGKIPGDLTFVFGHTHKPLAKHYKGKDFKVKDVDFDTYYPNGVKMYNTGGWIVESPERKEKRGGAILLLDEELNTTLVEMYKERKTPKEYVVKVVEAKRKGQKESKFHKKIAKFIGDDTGSKWGQFSRVACNAVDIRAHYLEKRQKE